MFTFRCAKKHTIIEEPQNIMCPWKRLSMFKRFFVEFNTLIMKSSGARLGCLSVLRKGVGEVQKLVFSFWTLSDHLNLSVCGLYNFEFDDLMNDFEESFF